MLHLAGEKMPPLQARHPLLGPFRHTSNHRLVDAVQNQKRKGCWAIGVCQPTYLPDGPKHKHRHSKRLLRRIVWSVLFNVGSSYGTARAVEGKRQSSGPTFACARAHIRKFGPYGSCWSGTFEICVCRQEGLQEVFRREKGGSALLYSPTRVSVLHSLL